MEDVSIWYTKKNTLHKKNFYEKMNQFVNTKKTLKSLFLST